jgi:hypothetical protein
MYYLQVCLFKLFTIEYTDSTGYGELNVMKENQLAVDALTVNEDVRATATSCQQFPVTLQSYIFHHHRTRHGPCLTGMNATIIILILRIYFLDHGILTSGE